MNMFKAYQGSDFNMPDSNKFLVLLANRERRKRNQHSKVKYWFERFGLFSVKCRICNNQIIEDFTVVHVIGGGDMGGSLSSRGYMVIKKHAKNHLEESKLMGFL